MQRLEQTEQNLLRLHDIIAEVERSLEPLEREAEKATRYREWSERLREIQIALLYQQWAKRKRAWHAKREEVMAAEQTIHRLRLELNQVQHERSKMEQAWQNQQRRLGELQTEVQQTEKTLHELRTQCEVLDERMTGLEQDAFRHLTEKNRLNQHADIAKRLEKIHAERLACGSLLLRNPTRCFSKKTERRPFANE